MSLSFLRLSLAAFLVLSTAAFSSAATIVISEDDFDGNTGGNALNANGSMSATLGTDPLDPTNGVSCIDISPGGQWGTYYGDPAHAVDMATMGISQGDTITYSYDVLVPDDGAGNAVTNAGNQDRVSMIVRWGDAAGNIPNQGNTTPDVDRFNHPGHATNLTPGVWTTITNSIVIPVMSTNPFSTPPNQVVIPNVSWFLPIWSFHDDSTAPELQAVAGTTVYVDNWSIAVETVPEPTGLILMLGLVGGAFGIVRRRRA